MAGNISIVLVDTHHPGNVGAAARAMGNMGLGRLKLVNPPDIGDPECERLAASAYSIVLASERFTTLEHALAGEHVVVGSTSSRGRKRRRRLHAPREIAPLILDFARSRRVALLFGPERRGLNEAQIASCHYIVTIPSDPLAPTLNVAQAVLVFAYELFLGTEKGAEDPKRDLATHEEREAMYRHMEEVLVEIGFLSSSNPGHILRSIRHFLGRAELTPRDIKIVRGIMSQMDWYVKTGRHRSAEKVRKP